MTRVVSPTWVMLAALLGLPCWGCGSSTTGSAPTPLLHVKGKVTYKGQPLNKGQIEFEPDGYGRPARGELHSDGTYELSTLQPADGVVAGSHRISITQVDKSLARDRAFQKYTSPNTSQLTADVTPEKTEFNFDLK